MHRVNEYINAYDVLEESFLLVPKDKIKFIRIKNDIVHVYFKGIKIFFNKHDLYKITYDKEV